MNNHEEHADTILSYYRSQIQAGFDETTAMARTLKMYDDIKFNRNMQRGF